ncbi:MAG: hypothetical protein HEQ38_18880 [Gemmatimonas sp.]|jgi:hypothetical protein|uniref:hypothetical protein n=1 Tax=Gemmatimonas sp. TaxID=1962908 RepID=UPI0031CA0796|nr:hypothetical protein [Gemmatimonas sp.]
MANLDAGNFRLVPRVRVEATTAINYDVMVEHSFKDVGSIAVSPDAQQIVPPANGPTASLYGFEVAWPQTGNVGLFFDRGPLSLRVSAHSSGSFVSTISAVSPEADTRTKWRFQVDASGSYQLRQGMMIFGEFINLSNTPLRAYVGSRQNRGGSGDDPSYEFYKPWGMVGVKIER